MAAKTSNQFQWLPEDEELLGTQVFHPDIGRVSLNLNYLSRSRALDCTRHLKLHECPKTFANLYDWMPTLIVIAWICALRCEHLWSLQDRSTDL